MSDLLDWLQGGNLRSDGAADQAAEAVLNHEELFSDLIEGLDSLDEVIRGRAADALEKVARKKPDLFKDHHISLIEILKKDKIPMVRWHLAMLLGHLALHEETISASLPVLLDLLRDHSVFVKSWAITSLTIIARMYPEHLKRIAEDISGFKMDKSAAIRTRVRYALAALSDADAPFPKGWNKSELINL